MVVNCCCRPCNILYDFVMVSGCSIDAIENEEAAKAVVEKIFALLVEDRLWSNCLGKAIRNASNFNVEEYSEKLGKTIVKHDVSVSEKHGTKISVVKVMGKGVLTPKATETERSASSESKDSPRTKKGVEMSSGRQYAKDFKPPVIFALTISSKDLFPKRNRDDKSSETDMSKASHVVSPFTCLATSGGVFRKVEQFQALQAKHGECGEKILMLEDEADLSLKATELVHKEFDDFADKVMELENKMLVDAKAAAT